MIQKIRRFFRFSSSTEETSTQSYLPISDIEQFHQLRKDGWHVAGIRFHPVNIDLLSKKERKTIIHRLFEVQNGMQGVEQFFCVGRSVDLDGYISHLKGLLQKTDDPIRRKILQSQIREAAHRAISGEALETLFYVLFAAREKTEVMERTKQFALDLQNRQFGCHLCDEKELMDMNFVFTHPAEAAFERMPEDTKDYIPPQLLRERRGPVE